MLYKKVVKFEIKDLHVNVGYIINNVVSLGKHMVKLTSEFILLD